MKPVRFLVFFLLFFITSKSSFGQTQMEMTSDAGTKYYAADSELNTVYRKILKIYSADTLFVQKIKIAQRLWVQLRDADVNAMYLPGQFYGSVEPMCKYEFLEDLTKQRINFLKVWVEGEPEGDVCGGTIRVKQ